MNDEGFANWLVSVIEGKPCEGRHIYFGKYNPPPPGCHGNLPHEWTLTKPGKPGGKPGGETRGQTGRFP
jgi:hypothetical protein